MDVEEIKKQKTTQELLEFGIININKCSGPTSFNVSDFVKNKLRLRKTSHFGTLDPKVTGVLPIALNRACKLTGHFIGHDKEYVGIMRMHEEVPLETIKKIIKEKFMGIIIQLPPVKSRVKRAEREREIKSFELIEQDGKDILFRTTVQGGTYIRKLIDDLGKALGMGAHMLELHRIKAGIINENDKKYPSINLYDFERVVDEYFEGKENPLREIIIPGEIVSKIYPVVEIKKESVGRILHGQPIYTKDLVKKNQIKKDEKISVFSGQQFIGIFKIINDERIFAKTEFTLQPI